MNESTVTLSASAVMTLPQYADYVSALRAYRACSDEVTRANEAVRAARDAEEHARWELITAQTVLEAAVLAANP